MKRRTLLQRAAALTVSLGLGSRPLFGATVPSYAEQYPDMLATYLTRRLNRLDAEWARKRSAIRTAEDLRARNVYVREKLIEMLG